jgi:hypothetical protein
LQPEHRFFNSRIRVPAATVAFLAGVRVNQKAAALVVSGEGGYMPASKRTVSFRLNAWANPRKRMIHVASPEVGIISTISNDPNSERYHPNLFKKLRRVLVDKGQWPEGM